MFNGKAHFFSRLFYSRSTEVAISGSGIGAKYCGRRFKNENEDLEFFVRFTETQREQVFPNLEENLLRVFRESPWRHTGVNFILASDLVRYFIVTPIKGSLRFQDCIDSANLRFIELYGGEEIEAWQIQASWSIDLPFLACAVHKNLLMLLERVAKASCFQIDSVVPEFVHAWNKTCSSLSDEKWLIVNEGQSLLIGINGGSVLRAVRRIPLLREETITLQSLSTLLEHEAFQFDVNMPSEVLFYGAVIDQLKGNSTLSISYWGVKDSNTVKNSDSTVASIFLNNGSEI